MWVYYLVGKKVAKMVLRMAAQKVWQMESQKVDKKAGKMVLK